MRCESIAVVGMGFRLPGADSPRTLWNNLCDGLDVTGDIPPERWGVGLFQAMNSDAAGRIRGRRAGLVSDVDAVDANAFRLSKRELRQMDPQHRILFECAWHALEDAGLPLEGLRGSRTGVFVGSNFNDFQRMLARDWAALDGYSLLGTTPAFAANRISYAFDLRGPSTCSSVGCASSTVAVHEACRSLLLGEVELALAGGVELMLSPDSSIMLSQAGVLSSTGQCRTLDAGADGYVRGEGAGMIVLKRLSQVAPGERVYAVIRGGAVNHNGRNEWLMAPSVEAQADVIRQACERGGVAPASLDYVELHGSSFLKGDAAEALAIGQVLGGQRAAPCRLGAVSNNLGYLGAAAGIAQLIKVCLSLWHRTLPPTIHVDAPNPLIPFEELGLSIQTGREAWPVPALGEPRRAGVVSTSLGGANAFLVLEEAPARPPQTSPDASVEAHLLVFSAQSPEGLIARARQLRDFLVETDEAEARLVDVCFTAALKRQHHRHRVAMVGSSRAGLVSRLEDFLLNPAQTRWVEQGQPTSLVEASETFVDSGYVSREVFLVGGGACVSLPIHPFQRQRLWPEWLTPEEVSRAPGSVRAPVPAAAPVPERPGATDYRAGTPAEREARLADFLRAQLAEVLELEVASLDTRARTFFELGLNSLGVAQLKARITGALGIAMSATVLFEHPRLDALASRLRALMDDTPAAVPEGSHGEEWALVERIAGLSEEQARELIARKLAELTIEVG
ncbi:polyketide synthase [Myxococcaceae bacterium JPH2]|nr:polyketide synthase [Myxococcaceae bacterium JPH2]